MTESKLNMYKVRTNVAQVLLENSNFLVYHIGTSLTLECK